MEAMKCKYCKEREIKADQLVPLCWKCEPMLIHAAEHFRISLEEAINSVWAIGPDRKGCTTLMYSRA